MRGSLAGSVASFRGIPYAAAPEGPLRFQAPAPRAGWDGVRDATAFGTPAPQSATMPGTPALWQAADGLDCLNLNVWTPDPGGSGLPVLVWVHGGAWKHGAGSNPAYESSLLASHGAVVVTLNYRLGFEGFGHLPGVPDNRGLRDQIAALEWVRDNIAGFGGDPGNVTVFGQSAGGGAVALLVGCVPALFRRAIAQSVPEGYWPARRAERITAKVAAAAGIPATAGAFAALPPEAIVAVQEAPLRDRGGITAYVPVIDGETVTGAPWQALAGGAARDIDLVCGFTHEEYRLFMPGDPPAGAEIATVAGAYGLDAAAAAERYRAAYPEFTETELFSTFMSDALFRLPSTWTAEAHAAAGGRTWLYDFTRGGRLGACHAVEVPFVFGNRSGPLAAWALGTVPADEFEALSKQIRESWVGFAATGDPGWPRFEPDSRRTRIWDAVPTDGAYPIEDSYRIWASTSPSGPPEGA